MVLDRFLPSSRPALFILLLANISFTLLYLEARKAEVPAPPYPVALWVPEQASNWRK